jgi:O-antigen ligase
MGGYRSRPNNAIASSNILAIAGLVALPFVFPLSAGPSASMWQLLVSWASVALLLIVARPARPATAVALWLSVVAAAILLSLPLRTDVGGSACIALGILYAVACVGAGLRHANATVSSAFAWGLLAAAVLSSLLGLLQYYGLAASLVPWTEAPEHGQAYGSLRQRNQFATLISMGLIAALWLHATAERRLRPALLAAGVLLIVALAASTSRTGLLELLLLSVVSAYLAWRERRAAALHLAATTRCLPPPCLLVAITPAYFAAAWALPVLAGNGVETMIDRLRQGAPDAHSRLVLWHNVLDLIAQRPWTGWGWGELAFAHYGAHYDGLRFVEILDNAHNLPLHLAVELGIPAALVICSGFGWLVLAARPWRETDPLRLMAWGLLGVILLHSLLEYPLWYGPFQLVFGLCLGLLWPSSTKKAPAAASRARVVAPGMAAALVLLAIVGYAAWDYTRVSQLYLAREERLPPWRDDTLAKVQDSWLFADQVRFAELALTPVDAGNAARVHALAQRVLHFSPEPRVIAKLIDSAMLLGRGDEAFAQARRFSIAFPREYARWRDNEPLDGPAE